MSNNGVIIERLSGKKLAILVGILISLQIGFFVLGALRFPNATHTETVEGIMCRDKDTYKFWQSTKEKSLKKINEKDANTFYYLRDKKGRSISNCEHIEVDNTKHKILNANPEEIVYAFQIPLPRDDQVLKLHRFFQTMTSVLHLQVLLPPSENQLIKETTLTHAIPIDVKLAYQNSPDLEDVWHKIASAKLKKEFTCVRGEYSLDCEMVQLYELGSVHHEFYLINLKLGNSKVISSLTEPNQFVPKLSVKDDIPDVRIMMTFIYQTGGFTQMWLIMKTCIFPFVLLVMCWFWNRIRQLDRAPNLLEQMLFALGISLTLLNLPIEWLTLWYDLKWMLLYTDLRQGIFYSTLFTFWIMFCGEHLMDDSDTKAWKTFKSYWKYISIVWVGCVSLLLFELCQRGMQLSDPFFSMWDTETGSNIAIMMLVLACFSGVVYFGLLSYLVGKVFWNFYRKQSQLPAMNKMRRAFYEGIIYRFKFLLACTLICAAFTVSFFIVNSINDVEWYFSEDDFVLNYTAGFLTGVYGMWNIYVSAVMIFYAPSHKDKTVAQHYENHQTGDIGMQSRLIQGEGHISTTESIVTAFANKISAS